MDLPLDISSILLVQVGALVGASVIIFMATAPSEEAQKSRAFVKGALSSENMEYLKGHKRYAPALRAQTSMGSSDFDFQ